MTRTLERLEEVAAQYDAVVFDQWGVLHNGSEAYAEAPHAIAALNAKGIATAVLSNSGKRAAPNAARIAALGFADVGFDHVMTSGEALWQDIKANRVPERIFFPIARARDDAAVWSAGLDDLRLTENLDEAEAVLLMGLPDVASEAAYKPVLEQALSRQLPVYCSNPDRASPRAGGQVVVSPGALAFDYLEAGGRVAFYGKPHRPVFDALDKALGGGKALMVGDSLEHDIAGAHGAGWDSLLVQNGLYAARFSEGDPDAALTALCASYGVDAPTYMIKELS